jgi:hypothetical protein
LRKNLLISDCTLRTSFESITVFSYLEKSTEDVRIELTAIVVQDCKTKLEINIIFKKKFNLNKFATIFTIFKKRRTTAGKYIIKNKNSRKNLIFIFYTFIDESNSKEIHFF